MSGTDSKNTDPKPRRRSRIPYGILSAIQLVLAGFIVLAANYLSSANHKTRDLTKHGDFTLSSLTTNLLTSDLISEREDPIKVTMMVSKSSLHYARLRKLTEEYKRVAGDMMEIEFVDPVRDTDRAQEISDAYNSYIIFEDFFIVDATPKPKTAEETAESSDETTAETSPAKAEPKTKPKNHVRFVPVKEMLVFRNDPDGQRRRIAYRDEDLLSAAILAAAEGTPRLIYFLSDKSQLKNSGANSPWTVLSENLRRQNVTLQPIKLSNIESIPDDAEGLALVAPEYDLDEREMDILLEYWERPRAALMVILNPAYRPRNLQSFLRQHGVRMRNDRIITLRNDRRVSDVPVTFTYGAQTNQINTDLQGESTTFEGSSASLEVEENAARLLNRRILPIPLIEASTRFWGETRYQEESPTFDPTEDTKHPLYLAAAVTRGNATGEEETHETSRMVVISNTDFLHPNNQYRAQIDFITNSTHWLINREDLIGVGPQPIQKFKLNLVPEQVSFVNRINLFIIPGLFLLAALVVANARRV